MPIARTDAITGVPVDYFFSLSLVTVAQFEREWSNERSLHGLIKARARGVRGGRLKTYTDVEIAAAMKKTKGNYEKAGKLIGAKKITMIRRWKKMPGKLKLGANAAQ
jgi:DNA invertase Pin-like site-specific DNA recombinase